MKRRIWTKGELSESFRVNGQGVLERMNAKHSPKGVWSVVECKANTTKGYCEVYFRGAGIKYHTIIWILVKGGIEDADAVIDHIDGDKLNNKIENLRLVSNRENCQNKESHRNGRLQGCYFHKQNNKWKAQIVTNGKVIALGYYETELDAHGVYCKALTMLDKSIEEIKEYFAIARFSSNHKGVSFHKQSGKWLARIAIKGKQISLGSYDTEIEAHQVYDEALTMVEKNVEEIQKHFNVAQFSSKYKGVSYDKRCNKWKALIKINGRRIHLGSFDTEIEAHTMYCKAFAFREKYINNKQFRKLLNCSNNK
jgi:hypothetical protein